jgi:hypothetical protein
MNEIVRIIFHYFVRNYNATETAKEILETVVSNQDNPYLHIEGAPGYKLCTSPVIDIYKMIRKQIHYYT